jgi:hypothetical protein
MRFQKVLPFMIAGVLAVSMTTTSCKKDKDPDPTDTTATTNVLTGDVAADKALTAGTWTLKGYVYVKAGATLTIPAGTIIKSDVIEKGALIVERGGKIMAEGTAAKPIVFTSGLPKGQRRPGDWGGIILLGKAPTNRSTEPTIEGGVDRKYGGTDANDNSGVMKYVRIEYAGIAAAPGSEINGLTFGGVGAGTTIENIMVSYGNDDAYEFFGGTVNCKNLIAYACLDDDYDFDFGYSGKIQYAISFKHPQWADQGDASNGIECDNDGTGTSAAPFTHPTLSNFTFVGPNGASNTQANHNFANRWRRACQFTLRNSVMIGFMKGGFSLESAETAQAYKDGTSQFKNVLVHAIAAPFKVDSKAEAVMTAAELEAKAIADGCKKLASADEAQLTDPFKIGAPNFVPKGGSPAMANGDFTGLDAFFSATNFLGAMGTTDWTTGWANWDPNATDY